MRFNFAFHKTNLNGYCQAVEYTHWYEPFLIYILQFIVAGLILTPYFGGKFVLYLLTYENHAVILENRQNIINKIRKEIYKKR